MLKEAALMSGGVWTRRGLGGNKITTANVIRMIIHTLVKSCTYTWSGLYTPATVRTCPWTTTGFPLCFQKHFSRSVISDRAGVPSLCSLHESKWSSTHESGGEIYIRIFKNDHWRQFLLLEAVDVWLGLSDRALQTTTHTLLHLM